MDNDSQRHRNSTSPHNILNIARVDEIDYVVRPEDTYICAPIVKGEVINPKKCYLQMFDVILILLFHFL